MATITTAAPCEYCCGDSWRIIGVSYQALNPIATCTAYPSLGFTSECVFGEPKDVVISDVTGSIRIQCRTPLTGNDGKPFANPCRSKNISWVKIGMEWDIMEAQGAINVIIDSCSAVVQVDIEDCEEFSAARDARDFRATFLLNKCGGGCE